MFGYALDVQTGEIKKYIIIWWFMGFISMLMQALAYMGFPTSLSLGTLMINIGT
jgi:hypothetical protein